MNNREIKFRAWNKHTNKMINSVAILGIWEKFVTGFDRDYIHNSQDWGNQDDFAYDFELMQFTGLKDKNGNDICEGDVMRTIHFKEPNGKNNYLYHKIVWDNDYACFCAINIHAPDEKLTTSGNLFLYVYVKSDTEIIGNIYENTELIN